MMLFFLLACGDSTEPAKPNLPKPTMEQGRAYAKKHPEQVRSFGAFMNIDLPETAKHAAGNVRLHKKIYTKVDCSTYEVDGKKTPVCLFKDADKCGFLDPVIGEELIEGKYDWSQCKNAKPAIYQKELHLNLGSVWVNVSQGKAIEVEDPSKKAQEDYEKKQKEKCERAEKNKMTAKQAQKEFRSSSWKGLPALTSQLFDQIYCVDKNGDQARIFSMINDMLQPELKKQKLAIKVDPSIKGIPSKGTLSKCKMEYNGGLGTQLICKSSINVGKLEKAAGGSIELECEKPYDGERFVPYSFSMSWGDDTMSVGECFGSGSSYVTVKPSKK